MRWSPTSRSSRRGANGSSRAASELIDFAEKHQIPIAKDKRGEAPFSVDANLLHSSSEGKVLEDPAVEPPDYVYQRTISPEEAPDKATDITIGFEKGDAVSINGKAHVARRSCSTTLNDLGRDNGIGRLDLVENRFVGMKSRGIYETPGGTILLAAHRAIEIDHARPRRHAPQGRADAALCGAHLQRLLVLARARDAAGADRQEPGARRGRGALKLYKGNVIVIGRESPKSLYSSTLVTFEDDKGAYDQKDAAGFIKLNALRLRTLAMRDRVKS